MSLVKRKQIEAGGRSTATASTTVALNTTAPGQVILSTNHTTLTGAFLILFSGGFDEGLLVVGSNGVQIEIRVGGVLQPATIRDDQVTATLVLSLGLSRDAFEMGTIDLQTAAVGSTTLIEVLALKLGGVSTADATGARTLIVVDI